MKQSRGLELLLTNNIARQERLLDLFIDEHLEKIEFERKKEVLVLQQREYEDSLTSLKYKNKQTSETVAYFLEQCKRLHISYLGANFEKKRLIAKNLFSNMELRAGKLEISTNFPYSLWDCQSAFRYCADTRGTPRTF